MAKPEPSEWGKLNAGQTYGILATDLGRAIFGVPWGKYELPLIYYLIEHSWGVAKSKGGREKDWPDPVPCVINLARLAKEWGYPKQRLYEARDRLKMVNFMLETHEGAWINKNAHEWCDPITGQTLLSPAMLTYAASARTRKSKTHKQTSDTLQRDSEPTHKQTSDTLQRDSKSHSSVTGSHAPALLEVTLQRDSRGRVVEGRAELDSRFQQTSDLIPPQPPTGEGAGVVSDSIPPPPAIPSSAEVERVAALAEHWFPMANFDGEVRRCAGQFRLDCLAAAIEAAGCVGKKCTFAYVRTIAARYEREGVPPPPATGTGRGADSANGRPVAYRVADPVLDQPTLRPRASLKRKDSE